MPFDVRDFTGALPEDRASSRQNRRLVGAWLLTVAGMILVMVALGGATRLTGSGLSIMEWAPFRGTLPPMNEAEWLRLFDLYKQIPQYALVNDGFGLAGFKHIFWLEWTHRLWGRLIGLVLLVPLVFFWATGRIERRLIYRLGLLFMLGGLQGAVGWFMVASGFFANSTAVSAYRLVVHLVLALVLYSAVLWTALSVLTPRPAFPPAPRVLRTLIQATTVMIGITIVAGGFVAGIHAGLDYNTFPLMAGKLVPDGYGALHPFLRNLTENIAAVQFDHRILATVTATLALATLVIGATVPAGVRLRPRLIALGLTVVAQYVLGVMTLLLVVPVDVATAHQVGATLLLTASLVLLHAVRATRVR
jgi:cytochrome c oxidase assembly protein subunit 15